MERWQIQYHPDAFESPPEVADFPFLQPHFTPEEIKNSLATDRRGMRQATLNGMPVVSDATGLPLKLDEEGLPIEDGDLESKVHYQFMLFEPTLINGEPRQVGVQNLLIAEDMIARNDSGNRAQYPTRGGDLAKLLYPVVIADERALNPNAKPEEAWGWLPPPLIGEGQKVQSGWLHDFLLDPYAIRPSTVLRMPKFNMSSDEASALVNYFAAVDGADYPYEFDSRTRLDHLLAAESQHPEYLQDAMKIVTNVSYCVQCHLLGDYTPPGRGVALAPQLDRIHERMRPEYLRGWLGEPKRFLPYTGMPKNIPYDPNAPPHYGGVSQDLFPGTSIEQLDGVVDLLMNFDRFTKNQYSVKPLIKPAEAATPETGDAASN
jgi:hypothetical protein